MLKFTKKEVAKKVILGALIHLDMICDTEDIMKYTHIYADDDLRHPVRISMCKDTWDELLIEKTRSDNNRSFVDIFVTFCMLLGVMFGGLLVLIYTTRIADWLIKLIGA